MINDALKKLQIKRKRTGLLLHKGIISLQEYGFSYTLQKVIGGNKGIGSYSKWLRKPLFTEAQLGMQRSRRFSRDITFSITVPLYNTPELFLRDMIESVLAQTYAKWELCMADGSDEEHKSVERICEEYAREDQRIKYQRLEKNLGISGNSNACLDMATGEYIALFDHDDILHPAALHEMMVAICEKDADFIYTDEATFISPDIDKIPTIHFKPDFAPDNLRANNYICHFTAFDRSLLSGTGAFRSDFDGSQDHDLILRLTAVAKKIVHIPEVLYYWRAHKESTALTVSAKDYAAIMGRKAVKSHLESLGLRADVESTTVHPCIYRICYEITGNPRISIVITNYENAGLSNNDLLKKCIESIQEKSTYENYEIVIIDQNSKNPHVLEYYDEIQQRYSNVTVVSRQESCNSSTMINYGVNHVAKGDYILLLNNNTEVISPKWMEEMLMYAQREDVGAVGAMLYDQNNFIHHAGIILGMAGMAGSAFSGVKRGSTGYMGRLHYTQNVSAVTSACMLFRRNVWNQAGGLDEGFSAELNGIDLCMKMRKAGYLIVWTPFAELYYYKALSRDDKVLEQKRNDFSEQKARSRLEKQQFRKKWSKEIEAGDPYYNPNFSLIRSDFSLRYEPRFSRNPLKLFSGLFRSVD